MVLADEDLAAGLDVERGAAREHLEENDRGRVEIAPPVERELEHLLGAHVRAGAGGEDVWVVRGGAIGR